MTPETAMVKFDAARLALAEAHSVDEVKLIRDQAQAIRAYLRQQKASVGMQNHAAEIKIRAERRLGEMLAIMDKNPGGPVRSHDVTALPPKYADLGIVKQQASRWQKEAEIPDAMLESYLEHCEGEAVEATTAGFMRFAADRAGSDGNEWYTPAAQLDAVRRVLGAIDVDPASCEYAQHSVQAATFYTKEDSGLDHDWPGRVFLNPPYSHPEVELFTQYLIEQFADGITTAAILLVNNCTDAKWFQALLRRFPACFTDGRIHFERPDAEKFATRQGQAFFYLGPNMATFAEVFNGPIGTVVEVIG